MKNMKRKTILMLAAAALLLTFTVSGTLAYLVAGTDPVENVFTPAHVSVDVTDNNTATVKSNVVITNTSDIQAYIRAAIVGYWCQDVDGKKIVVADWNPTDTTQGEFDGLTGDGWEKLDDGYYYYTSKVDAGAATGTALFNTYTVGTAPVEGAYLVIDILAQAVQAEPKDAAAALWGNAAAALLN